MAAFAHIGLVQTHSATRESVFVAISESKFLLERLLVQAYVHGTTELRSTRVIVGANVKSSLDARTGVLSSFGGTQLVCVARCALHHILYTIVLDSIYQQCWAICSKRQARGSRSVTTYAARAFYPRLHGFEVAHSAVLLVIRHAFVLAHDAVSTHVVTVRACEPRCAVVIVAH